MTDTLLITALQYFISGNDMHESLTEQASIMDWLCFPYGTSIIWIYAEFPSHCPDDQTENSMKKPVVKYRNISFCNEFIND